MTPSRRGTLTAAAICAYVACYGCAPCSTPIDPALVVVNLQPLAYRRLPSGAGSVEFAFNIQNGNACPIYLLEGDRMPYVTVVDTSTVQIRLDVADSEYQVTIFEPPRITMLGPGQEVRIRMSIEHPFAPSDHFHRPITSVPTESSVAVSAVVGFGESELLFSPASGSNYRDLLDWQERVESQSVQLTNLLPP